MDSGDPLAFLGLFVLFVCCGFLCLFGGSGGGVFFASIELEPRKFGYSVSYPLNHLNKGYQHLYFYCTPCRGKGPVELRIETSAKKVEGQGLKF